MCMIMHVYATICETTACADGMIKWLLCRSKAARLHGMINKYTWRLRSVSSVVYW